MTTETNHFDMNAAPLRIGTVRLKVRDRETVAAFYRSVLGLEEIGREGEITRLGTGDTPLLELAGDPTLAPNDPRRAGLFHTAFLMPKRADLGRWLSHAATTGIRLQGASDHIVSEALYLADPEGNGIEIYADRPITAWRAASGEIRMATDPLDLQDLLRSASGTGWAGFPAAGRIGHVHLQVGDTGAADGFYRDILGFDIAARYPGASFYGSGGYHHQLAGNVWNSRNAGERPRDMAGLDRVELIARDAATIDAIRVRAGDADTGEAEGIVVRDPWGTTLAVRIGAGAAAR